MKLKVEIVAALGEDDFTADCSAPGHGGGQFLDSRERLEHRRLPGFFDATNGNSDEAREKSLFPESGSPNERKKIIPGLGKGFQERMLVALNSRRRLL
jgi:hypothetical protein